MFNPVLAFLASCGTVVHGKLKLSYTRPARGGAEHIVMKAAEWRLGKLPNKTAA
jgi:hypothetical protein